MEANIGLNVYSEIGKLKRVLLHRPGREIENITPELMDRLLFDDIPYLKVARKEHDIFCNILKKAKVEVVYLEDLICEALKEEAVKSSFIEEFVRESNIRSEKKKELVKDFLIDFSSTKDMVVKMIEGIEKEDISDYKKTALSDIMDSNYPFIVDPMPNLYFTRDPFVTIGRGIALNTMKTVTRSRETLFSKYIFEHHPQFKIKDLPYWYNRNEDSSIEGGDILVLSKKVIAVGISERTEAHSVEKLAKNIFNSNESFEVVLAFDIPKKRAFMHLDTVFTMVDYNKFTIHPQIEEPLTIYSIKKAENIKIEEERLKIEDVLKKYLDLDEVVLVKCGGGNIIHAGREQWNDGSNTLAIAPGEVIVYSRNYVTNKLLEESGVKIHKMPSSELSRGRGGPRCMSMPLNRENL